MLQVNHGNYGFGMKIFGENLARAGLSLYSRINDLPLLQCLKFFDSQKIMCKVKAYMKHESKSHAYMNINFTKLMNIDNCI